MRLIFAQNLKTMVRQKNQVSKFWLK